MNIGIRPTVDGRENLAEVYIVGFSGNIYGRELRVVFHHRLRDELRFRDVDALKRQIQADVDRIVQMLS
jgi:riboflavin kinase/FMN adenylyltransferase